MTQDRKYAFSWDLIGDLDQGRPRLGKETRLEMYRLMEYTFRDVMEQALGAAKTDQLFYAAGKLAGNAIHDHLLQPTDDLQEYLGQIQELFREMKVGIVRVEQADPAGGTLVLSVEEDLDCSGLPETGEQICTYDEGLIAGLLESFTGVAFRVHEVDCWSTGDRVCRFQASSEKEGT